MIVAHFTIFVQWRSELPVFYRPLLVPLVSAPWCQSSALFLVCESGCSPGRWRVCWSAATTHKHRWKCSKEGKILKSNVKKSLIFELCYVFSYCVLTNLSTSWCLHLRTGSRPDCAVLSIYHQIKSVFSTIWHPIICSFGSILKFNLIFEV